MKDIVSDIPPKEVNVWILVLILLMKENAHFKRLLFFLFCVDYVFKLEINVYVGGSVGGGILFGILGKSLEGYSCVE